MKPPVRPGSWVGIFLLLAVSVQTETEVYGKLGGEVSLHPDTIDSVTRITWKEGPDIAMEWEGAEIDSYRQFKERGHLNTSTGVLTITGLTAADSGYYTPEINNAKGSPSLRLSVITGVPVPTVSIACEEDMSKCVMMCVGDTTRAGPVTVVWLSDDHQLSVSTTMEIRKEESSDVKAFSCELWNPVSRERSESFPNPFAAAGGLRISTGIIVFVCLLLALLLLVLFHRLKAGAWFFDKGSMPWEADFWQKSQAPREAAESNGSTAHQQTPDEETPMT